MKFYIATGKTKEKLLVLHKKHVETAKRRQEFVKRHRGAKGSVTHGNQFIGLVFKGETPAFWRLLKSSVVSGHCKPDTSKSGKSLRAEMEALATYSWMEVADAVGVAAFHPGEFHVPDFRVWGKTVVFGVDDRDTPNKDCHRISDVQYEKMLAAQKNKKRGSV